MNSRWTGLIAIVLLTLLLCALLLRRSTKPREGPTPAETSGGRRWLTTHPKSRVKVQAHDRHGAVAAEAGDEVLVSVAIPPEQWRLHEHVSLVQAFDIEAVLPLADEAPWPDGEAALELELLLESPDADSRTFLEAAAREGYSTDMDLDVENPWGLVIALEAERQVARARYREDVGRRRAAAGGGPFAFHPPDFDALAVFADETAAAWSGHPVAEYARLYLAFAVRHEHDGGAVALDLLEDTEDPVVAEVALSQLVHHEIALDDRVLGQLSALRGEFPEHRPDLAILAMRSALSERRPALAAEWWQALGDDLDQSCGDVGATGYDAYYCPILERTEAQLQALGALPPMDWRESLRAAAVSCYFDDFPLGNVTLVGEWKTTWVWKPGAEAGSRCISSRSVIAPDSPVRVRLVISAPAGLEFP